MGSGKILFDVEIVYFNVLYIYVKLYELLWGIYKM